MSESAKKSLVALVYIVLVASTLLVFWQAGNFDFVNYDDAEYVYENPHVSSGLSHDSIIWAFTTGHASNWHPVTWLSHMLDCRLFGPKPGWMHLVNVFLHLASTLLLFIVLKKMTGALWPSAFVAAAFALHPMHVESVAWIAERKDVLSTFFLLLTLAAYVGYVKRPSIFQYLASLALFAFGLMAKPMLVTLPFLLLLLDYWPLDRLDTQSCKHDGRATVYRLMIEKIPFFVLAVVSCVVTFLVQQSSRAVKDIALEYRVVNALTSYVEYILKMFLPRNLAVYYHFDIGSFSLWQVAACVLLLLVISISAIRFGRTQRYLPVGWFWFVGTLVPVIGFVQVGGQAFADRYTYIPYIGLFIMIAWGLPQLLSKWPQRKLALGISAAAALAALGICAHGQVSHWNNSMTLFSHAIEVTQNNDLAYNNRGVAYGKLGRYQEAIEDLSQAVRIRPDYAEAHTNLGIVYGKLGRSAEAIDAFTQAVKIKPDNAETYNNLGIACRSRGLIAEAIDAFTQAIKIKPDFARAYLNLAWLIATNPNIKDRDTNEAIRLASRACELANYKDAAFLDTLAAAYASAGRFNEAIDTADKALSLASATNQPRLKNIIQHHLSFYQQGKPYIEPAPKPLPDPTKQ